MADDTTSVEPVDLARGAISLGAALVVALFAVFGVSGDLLTLAVRDHPVLSTAAVAAIIVGLTIPFFRLRTIEKKKATEWVDAIGFGLLLLGAVLTICVAAVALNDREQPSIAISPMWNSVDGGATTVTVTGSAHALRSTEYLTLTVIGIPLGASTDISEDCETYPLPFKDGLAVGDGAQILAVGTSGPTTGGDANASATIDVSSSEYKYVCAYARLSDRGKPANARSAFSILNLTQPAPVTTPKSSGATDSGS